MADEEIRAGDPHERINDRTLPLDYDVDERQDDRQIAKDDAGMGLLALYLSFLSCFIPGACLLTLYFSFVALLRRKPHASYGSTIVGNLSALLGIILSSVAIAIQGSVLYSLVRFFFWRR